MQEKLLFFKSNKNEFRLSLALFLFPSPKNDFFPFVKQITITKTNAKISICKYIYLLEIR